LDATVEFGEVGLAREGGLPTGSRLFPPSPQDISHMIQHTALITLRYSTYLPICAPSLDMKKLVVAVAPAVMGTQARLSLATRRDAPPHRTPLCYLVTSNIFWPIVLEGFEQTTIHLDIKEVFSYISPSAIPVFIKAGASTKLTVILECDGD
jgi:hypothetical protein